MQILCTLETENETKTLFRILRTTTYATDLLTVPRKELKECIDEPHCIF